MDPFQICQICSVKAKEKHYTHYGGVCCFSCKAFFRRIHQKDLVKKLACESQENCNIQTRNRTDCKRCRYLKCLNIGMDPEKVLNEQDRKKFTNLCSGKSSEEDMKKSYVKAFSQVHFFDFFSTRPHFVILCQINISRFTLTRH